MEEQFEYGEEVMVRVHDSEKWEKRQYIGTLEFGDTGLKWYCTHWKNKGSNNHEGQFTRWSQIRKIQKDETKSSETSPTRKEKSQLRGDAHWAIGQSIAMGHRTYGEIVRSAKLLIEAQNDLIKHMKETWKD